MVVFRRSQVEVSLQQFEKTLHVISSPSAIIEHPRQVIECLTKAANVIQHGIVDLHEL
jgi:hypothetical protein